MSITEFNPVVQQVFDCKWICNGFPKSGTHLLVAMVGQIAPYQGGTEAGLFDLPWAGTYNDNSFTMRRVPIEQTTYKISRVSNGKSIKSHLGYDKELARFLYLMGAVHIFIYRDLRDVAVSQAWHIINSKSDSLVFPDREAYPVDNFDEVLKLVIEGHQQFPSVVERWRYYTPWLNDENTMSVKFADLRYEPKVWAEKIFKFGMEYNASRWDRELTGYDEYGLEYLLWRMVTAAGMRESSPTFREGKTGGWKEAFNDEHIALWKEHDPERWLYELGFEARDWYG